MGKPRRRHFIKEWRQHRKMTQADLAEAIGVSISTISQLENYQQGYSQATLEALATVLGCDISDLLVRDPKHADPMWKIWEGLDETAKGQVTEIARTFRKTTSH